MVHAHDCRDRQQWLDPTKRDRFQGGVLSLFKMMAFIRMPSNAQAARKFTTCLV